MIFIVDDDPSVRTSLTRLMRSAGYHARAFAGAEAYLDAGTRLDAAASLDVGGGGTPADCLILDLHMPGMNGLDLQEVLRRLKSRVPVIVLTASEDPDPRAKAAAAGAVKVLRKPCDPAALLRAVAEATRPPPPP